jgi:hypothetical protein
MHGKQLIGVDLRIANWAAGNPKLAKYRTFDSEEKNRLLFDEAKQIRRGEKPVDLEQDATIDRVSKRYKYT